MFYLSLDKTSEKRRQSAQTISKLEEKLEANRAEVASLEQKESESSSSFITEKIVRDELLLKKPGEYIVLLPELEESDDGTELISARATPLEEWKQLLF